jgi:hypothetical protein
MKNPWLLFLYRVCQIGQLLAVLALLLLAAGLGLAISPQGQEDAYAIGLAVLTGVFLTMNAWRDNVSARHRIPPSF